MEKSKRARNRKAETAKIDLKPLLKDQTIGDLETLKDTKKYEESRQLQYEGYLCENRVELEDNAGVQSISSISKEGRDDDNGALILSNRRMPNGLYGGVRGRLFN